jgi:RND superfamily putative drug exporter
MKTVLKLKWLIVAIWIAAVAGLLMTAPNLADLVREKGQITVPEGYSSSIASELKKQWNAGEAAEEEYSAVLVFHSEQGLTESDMEEVKHAATLLKGAKDRFGITSVMTHFDTPELASQMVSDDGKTVLMLVNITPNGRTPAEMTDALYEAIADVKVEHYYTGDWIIIEDVIISSQEGLKKTEWITIVFILAILFIVFRSAVAPFIPLLSIGISYLAAQSVVAFWAEYGHFPLSNFTQIFMVAIMFGIGTDYCILLISRFKEELAHGADRTEAILATYRTAGKTVLFSGIAVLIGFISIGFSQFSLYRSSIAVAVGVGVLLIALATIVPFFMAVLGKAIFWPARGSLEHKESRLWGAVGSFSLRKPWGALVLIAVIVAPFLAGYSNTVSYNSLNEIGSKYYSVKGFNLIAESFGPGDSLPAEIVIHSEQPMATSEGLAAIEQISRELARVEGVKTVRSATRPAGEPLADFQVPSQIGQLESGVGQAGEGLGQISKGLAEASNALNSNAPKLQEAVQGAEQLIGGTRQLKAGVVQLDEGLRRIESGLRDGSAGASELSAGLQQAKASADQLAAAAEELLGHYASMGTGLTQLSQAYGEIAAQQANLAQGLADLGSGLSAIGQKYPNLAQDADYQRLRAAAGTLQNGAEQMAAGMRELNSRLEEAAQGINQANAGFEQAAGGMRALAQGLASLSEGLSQLQAGISQAAAGQGQIIARIPDMTQGLDQLALGQQELQAGFAQLNSQLGELTNGLNQSVSGLEQVRNGLSSAQAYMNRLAESQNEELGGWFMPEEALSNPDFQTVLDTYMSADRKTVKLDVVFAGNPYETDTMDLVDDLKAAVASGLANSGFEQAEFAVGGVTSSNADLRAISNEDYSRTVVFMLIGLFLILMLLFRSIVMPVYLIMSLLVTYYTSLAVTEAIFVKLLGYAGVSWAVPFFGFVMLMALGIDYSIFLMERFKEYKHLSPQEAILSAMKNMGTVIVSAAVILGGTFAAMLPSGVLSLLQIATLVLCGLFLYALVMLPLFVPVMVRLFGPANWWPFMKR